MPIDVVSEAFARKFHGAGAKFFVFWQGDDGTIYGIARAFTVEA
jgi:hypothetical protein